MNIQKEPIFEIMEVNRRENVWIVSGLAFGTIHINDNLALQEESIEGAIFRVTEISLYGKEIDEVTRGLTCKLTLKSQLNILLSEKGYLYKS